MIKSELIIKQRVDISQYLKLRAFLKKANEGYCAKKSRIFSKEQFETFLCEASDQVYLGTKSNDRQQELGKTPTNVAQSKDEKSRLPAPVETESFASDRPKQNCIASNDEEETFQDAETRTIYNIRFNEDSNNEENPEIIQDNHPGQCVPTKTIAIVDDNCRQKSQHFEYHMSKTDVPNILPMKTENKKMLYQTIIATESDSLDNSMSDSLELAESHESPAHELIDSIETGLQQEVEKYESLSQMTTDFIENVTTITEVVNTNSKCKPMHNSNTKLNEGVDSAGKEKYKQQNPNNAIDNITKSNRNLFIDSNSVSLSEILLNSSSKASIHSPGFGEVDSKSENEPKSNIAKSFTSDQCYSISNSALEELIRHVNETFVINGATVDDLDPIPANASSQLLTSENEILCYNTINIHTRLDSLEQLQDVEASLVKKELNKNDNHTVSLTEVAIDGIDNLLDVFNKNGKNDEDNAKSRLSTASAAQNVVEREKSDDQNKKGIEFDSSDLKLMLIDCTKNNPENNLKETKIQENKESTLVGSERPQIGLTIDENRKKKCVDNITENICIISEQEYNKECNDHSNEIGLKIISTVNSEDPDNIQSQTVLQNENAHVPTNLENPKLKSKEIFIGKVATHKCNKDKAHEMEIKKSEQPENLKCSVVKQRKKESIHKYEGLIDSNKYFTNTKPESTNEFENIENPLKKNTCELNTEQPCEFLDENVRKKNEELRSPQTKETVKKTSEIRQTLNSTGHSQNAISQVDPTNQTGRQKINAVHDKNIIPQEYANTKNSFPEIIEHQSNSSTSKFRETDVKDGQIGQNYKRRFDQKDPTKIENLGNKCRDTLETHAKTQIDNMLQQLSLEHNIITEKLESQITKRTSNGKQDTSKLDISDVKCARNMEQVLEDDYKAEFKLKSEEQFGKSEMDKMNSNEEERVMGEECNKKFERQSTQEFEILERQYRERNLIKSEFILEQSTSENSKKQNVIQEEQTTRDDPKRAFERQDTHEFEILERQCSERNKIKTEGILEDLVLEQSVKDKVEQVKLAANGGSRTFGRQDTKEFETLERQCDEKGKTKVEVMVQQLVKGNNRNNNVEQKVKCTPENFHKVFEEQAAEESENTEYQSIKGKEKGTGDIILTGLLTENQNLIDTSQNKNTTGENCGRVFERQDTQEFEILEKQCKEAKKIKTEDVLTALVSESKINKDNRQAETNMVGLKPKTEHNETLNTQNTVEFKLMERQSLENAGVHNIKKHVGIIKDLAVHHQAPHTEQEPSDLTKNNLTIEEHKETETLKGNRIIILNGKQANDFAGEGVVAENKEAPDRQDTKECENLKLKLKNVNPIVDSILEELINQSTSSIKTDINKASDQCKEEKQEINKALDKQKPQVFEVSVMQHTVDGENYQKSRSKNKSASSEEKLNSPEIEKDANGSTNICKTTIKGIITPNDIIMSKDDIRQNESTMRDASLNQEMYINKKETQVPENKFEHRSVKSQENIDTHINNRKKANLKVDTYNFETATDNMNISPDVPENDIKEIVQENKAAPHLNIKNKQRKAKSISTLIYDEHEQESISCNNNIKIIPKNEGKSRTDKLKCKVDLLQQELVSIRKENRRKQQVIGASALNKEDNKAAIIRYRNLLQEYEKSILKQTKEIEELKMESEKNIRSFSNTEMAFSDVFEKYEKTKHVIAAYRKNEEILLENMRNAEEQLSQVETKCFSMKQQSLDEIKRAQKQLENEKLKYKQDVAKLQAQVKRLEIKASSLEFALKQKSDECQALAALCDDITGRNSTESASRPCM